MRPLLVIFGLLVVGSTAWLLTGTRTWEELGLKLALAVPSGVLVLFLWRAYSQERHFEEEYAIRSALAQFIPFIPNTLTSDGKKYTEESIAKKLTEPIVQTKSEPEIVSKKTVNEIFKGLVKRSNNS